MTCIQNICHMVLCHVILFTRMAPVFFLSMSSYVGECLLHHGGRVNYIWVSKFSIIGSDNGLSPGRLQAIIWTSDGGLLIRQLGRHLTEILIEMNIFSLKKLQLKKSSGYCWPFSLGLNVLTGNGSEKCSMSSCCEFGWFSIQLWLAQAFDTDCVF